MQKEFESVPVLTIDVTEDFTTDEAMEDIVSKLHNFIENIK